MMNSLLLTLLLYSCNARRLDQKDVVFLNTKLSDDTDDISIYTSDFFDKTDSFKTLGQLKEDEMENKKNAEIQK